MNSIFHYSRAESGRQGLIVRLPRQGIIAEKGDEIKDWVNEGL